MIYEVEIEGRTHRIAVDRAEGGWTVRIDGGEVRRIQGKSLGRAEWLLREDGRGRSVGVWVEGDHAYTQVAGLNLRGTVQDPRAKALAHGGGDQTGSVVTPMPGIVNRITVHEGQHVEKGQVLLVVEAMKMENEFRSPCAGTVKSILVKPGVPVESNTTLVVVEPE